MKSTQNLRQQSLVLSFAENDLLLLHCNRLLIPILFFVTSKSGVSNYCWDFLLPEDTFARDLSLGVTNHHSQWNYYQYSFKFLLILKLFFLQLCCRPWQMLPESDCCWANFVGFANLEKRLHVDLEPLSSI